MENCVADSLAKWGAINASLEESSHFRIGTGSPRLDICFLDIFCLSFFPCTQKI